MNAVTVIAAMFAAQFASDVGEPAREDIEAREVAYEQVAGGEAQAAVSRLEALLQENPGDPALLINLGAALQQLGEGERAAEAYRSAIDSDTRYRLELADGSWVDSRHAARRALIALEEQQMALR